MDEKKKHFIMLGIMMSYKDGSISKELAIKMAKDLREELIIT